MKEVGLPTVAAPSGLEKAAKRDDTAALKKAAADFEAIFINHMLSTMRSTVLKSSLFHGDANREDIYNSLLDTELSKVLSAGDGLGLGKMLLEQMVKNSGVDDGPEAPKRPAPDQKPGGGG